MTDEWGRNIQSGVSTYVPTILYPPSLCTSAFPSPATQPSVRPIPTSISPARRAVIICPVPEGKGISSADKEKCFWAKWRGVEKCSGTKPTRSGAWDGAIVK
jgi:hypothetical protein